VPLALGALARLLPISAAPDEAAGKTLQSASSIASGVVVRPTRLLNRAETVISSPPDCLGVSGQYSSVGTVASHAFAALHRSARDLDLALTIARDRALTLTLTIASASASVSVNTSVLDRALDLISIGTDNRALDLALDLYVTLSLLRKRISDELPAYEGILLVRERRDKKDF